MVEIGSNRQSLQDCKDARLEDGLYLDTYFRTSLPAFMSGFGGLEWRGVLKKTTTAN